MKTHKSLITFVLMLIMTFVMTTCAFASNLDDIGGNGNKGNSNSTTNTQAVNEDGKRDDVVDDLWANSQPVTDEQMAQAKKITGPIVRVIGTLIGIILTITSSLIFLITALDLLYIAFPPVRTILNPDYGSSAPAGGGMGMGGMGMGGMGMGMGMRGGMGMGGMGGMGMAGNQNPASGSLLRRRWVSDEAVQVLAAATGGVAQAQQPMGGMGMGAGMMGMGMNQAAQGAASTKSVIAEYFKKRTFFMVLFVVCSVVLMSSALTDCGLNVAELVLRLIDKLNGAIPNIAN